MATVVAMAFPAKVRAMKSTIPTAKHHRTGVLHLADVDLVAAVAPTGRRRSRAGRPASMSRLDASSATIDWGRGRRAAAHRRVEGVADQTGRRVTVPDGLAHACVVGTDPPDREAAVAAAASSAATRSAGACAVVASVYVVSSLRSSCRRTAAAEIEQHRRHDLEGARPDVLDHAPLGHQCGAAPPRAHQAVLSARGPARRLRGTARQGRLEPEVDHPAGRPGAVEHLERLAADGDVEPQVVGLVGDHHRGSRSASPGHETAGAVGV